MIKCVDHTRHEDVPSSHPLTKKHAMTLARIDEILTTKVNYLTWTELTRTLEGLKNNDLEQALTRIRTATELVRVNPHGGFLETHRLYPTGWLHDVFDGRDEPRFAACLSLHTTGMIEGPKGRYKLKTPHLMNMLEVPQIVHLEELLLDQVKLTSKFFKALKGDHPLTNLTHLHLFNHPGGMKPSFLKAISAASFPNLYHLSLRMNYSGPELATSLVASEQLNALRALNVNSNHLAPEGVHTLTTASFMTSLELLDLGVNRMDDDSLAHVLDALSHRLLTLKLNDNDIEDAGIHALAEASHLNNLGHIDLTGNNKVTEEALAALVAAPHLQGSMKELRVDHGLTSALAQRIIDQGLLPNLQGMGERYTQPEGREAFNMLRAARPGLAVIR